MTQKIAIDPVRVAQLAQMRDTLGHTSYTETIRALIEAFASLHKIEVGIPGIDIRNCSDGLTVSFEGQPHEGLNRDRALALVKAIRDYLDEPGPRKTIRMSTEHNYVVRGRGRAIVVLIGEAERDFTPDVAAEFADRLEATARGI